MLKWITAERTSSTLRSDTVVRQRQLAAYYKAQDYIRGKSVMEIGCGEGFGTEVLAEEAEEILAIDYSQKAVNAARNRLPSSEVNFRIEKAPPVKAPDGRFDAVVMFQMIEHLQNPEPLLKEVRRVLKSGGTLLVSTVNKEESLSENPFHLHEFDGAELEAVLGQYFARVEIFGLFGDGIHTQYLDNNKKRVAAVKKLDVFGIFPRLPPGLQKVLYSVANRAMRISLRYSSRDICDTISHKNFIFKRNETDGCLDLFAACTK